MQFIHKQDAPPIGWENWFTTATGRRSFDYKEDYSAMRNIPEARKFLLEEQHYLCAYCQKEIKINTSSIEHVVPKSSNVPYSTVYQNLVAICVNPPKDPATKKSHCGDLRGDDLLTPILFHKEAQFTIASGHPYFEVENDGSIAAQCNLKDPIKKQVEAFIEILNLNISTLKKDRVVAYDKLVKNIPPTELENFLKRQIEIILGDLKRPFRQFLLLFITKKLAHK